MDVAATMLRKRCMKDFVLIDALLHASLQALWKESYCWGGGGVPECLFLSLLFDLLFYQSVALNSVAFMSPHMQALASVQPA